MTTHTQKPTWKFDSNPDPSKHADWCNCQACDLKRIREWGKPCEMLYPQEQPIIK